MQAHQMSSFIQLTSETCDAALVAGDFNFRPEELGYEIVRHGTAMKDAWLHQKVSNLKTMLFCLGGNKLTALTLGVQYLMIQKGGYQISLKVYQFNLQELHSAWYLNSTYHMIYSSNTIQVIQ